MQLLKLILLWLFLPIHFFFFVRRGGLLNKWCALFLAIVSPLSLVLLLILVIAIIFLHAEYQRKYHYTRRSVLNEIIGVELPKYNVVKRNLGEMGFNRDYQDCFYLEFKKSSDNSFTHQLDSLVTMGRGDKYGEVYIFHKSGNYYVNVKINTADNTIIVTSSAI